MTTAKQRVKDAFRAVAKAHAELEARLDEHRAIAPDDGERYLTSSPC